MNALLLLPGWSAADRVQLWTALRELNGRLCDETATADAPPTFEPAEAVCMERERALLRAQIVHTLLEQHGVADADRVHAALKKVNPAFPSPAPWRDLATDLRWRETGPLQCHWPFRPADAERCHRSCCVPRGKALSLCSSLNLSSTRQLTSTFPLPDLRCDFFVGSQAPMERD